MRARVSNEANGRLTPAVRLIRETPATVAIAPPSFIAYENRPIRRFDRRIRMRMRRLLLILVAAFPAVSPLYADEGVLQQVREQVKSPETVTKPSGPHKKAKDGEACDDSDDDFSAPGLGALALFPFIIPALALGDDYQTYSLFPRYPYACGLPGNLWLDRGQDGDPRPRGARFWSVEAAVEDGYSFRGVNRVGARFTLDTASRLGVTSDWDFFQERRPCGCYDELTVGDVNLTYRFAQCEWMRMFVGAGGRVMPERYDTRGGFNFTYGAEAFPCKPLVLSSSLDLGNLGSLSAPAQLWG
jgi:hypothetical protein